MLSKGANMLAEYRAQTFPVRYTPQRSKKIKVSEGYGAAVVIMPLGLNRDGNMDFRIELLVSADARSATFIPKGLGMMVIDVPFGRDATPSALTDIVKATWDTRDGRPPGPGTVRGKP